MVRYAPLPDIRVDPRTERQLVSDASQRVYQASGGTLNDFSSGSPVVALLEGQAFAQSEFLYWASKLPEAILIDWIGPFLGAQRKLGNPSLVTLQFDISPQDTPFVITEGFFTSTDPNLNNGVTVQFVTTQTLIIPPGSFTGTVTAVSTTTGNLTNVPPNTIVRFNEILKGLNSVTNPESSTGGEDFETVDQVKERFFSLIRRRNPVSAEDWQGLMEDLLGVGTITCALPRRSNFGSFDRFEDYLTTPGHFSLFSLNADGSELTEAQIAGAQNIINNKTPVGLDVHLYPKKLFEVDVKTVIQYNPGLPYSQNLQNLSLQLRELTRNILRPNREFPSDYAPSVTDIESALNSTFPGTFGSTNQYVDPDILSILTYTSPRTLVSSNIQGAELVPLETGFRVKEGDLVSRNENLFLALQSFNPVPFNKGYYTNTDTLVFRRILNFQPGDYKRSDVIAIFDSGTGLYDIRVVLKDFFYRERNTISELEANKLISPVKTFSDWVIGDDYIAIDTLNAYNPDIITLEETDLEGIFKPEQIANEPLESRPGWYVFLVNENFTREAPTSDFSTVQTQGLVSSSIIITKNLVPGTTYQEGDYIQTKLPEDSLCPADPFQFVVDTMEGVVSITARVLREFRFEPNSTETLEESIERLVANNIIRMVNVLPFEDEDGSFYENTPFRYSTRFSLGEYLRGRVPQADDTYYLCLADFTPDTSDLSKLIENRTILEVSVNEVPSTVRDIFRFIPGDTALFRQDTSRFRSFTATDFVTPVALLEVYEDNDLFVPTSMSETQKYFDRNYKYEQIIQDDEAFYRVIKPFTPLTEGTARTFELQKLVLKLVVKKECSERIQNAISAATSANQLGFFDIQLVDQSASKFATRFIWEQDASLSFVTPGNEEDLVDYGDGTLAL